MRPVPSGSIPSLLFTTVYMGSPEVFLITQAGICIEGFNRTSFKKALIS